jgi:hypothetical protein
MTIDDNDNAELSYATISTLCSQKADVSYDDFPLACACRSHADFHNAYASVTGTRAEIRMTMDDNDDTELLYATISTVCPEKANVLYNHFTASQSLEFLQWFAHCLSHVFQIAEGLPLMFFSKEILCHVSHRALCFLSSFLVFCCSFVCLV